MSRSTRKLIAILVLVIGLPLYVLAAGALVSAFERPPFVLEMLIYVALGVAWILPLRRLFLGIARPDPDADRERTDEAPPRRR